MLLLTLNLRWKESLWTLSTLGIAKDSSISFITLALEEIRIGLIDAWRYIRTGLIWTWSYFSQ